MTFEIAPKSTEIQANWETAKAYCSELNIDGKTGWRLPTKEELNEIYESGNGPELEFDEWLYYWTSTDDGDSAWDQGFGNGYQYLTDKNKTAPGPWVRAIRDL